MNTDEIFAELKRSVDAATARQIAELNRQIDEAKERIAQELREQERARHEAAQNI